MTATRSVTTIARARHILDATDVPIGRLASRAVTLLRGKHKSSFTPHVDAGDFVHIVNLRSARVREQKRTTKLYYRHSGYPGGLHARSLGERLDRHPTEVVRDIVRRMLPPNRLRARIIQRVTVSW